MGFADVRSDAELRAVAEGLGDARFDAIVNVWRLLEKRASEAGPPFVDRLGEPLDW